MTKFCIDLEDMMLPDAIAAVIEAWYDAQVLDNANADWENELRFEIKNRNGRGWSVRAMNKTRLNPNGVCQLTQIKKIGNTRTRNSITLPFEWCKENSLEIEQYVNMIHDLLHDGNAFSLKEAQGMIG